MFYNERWEREVGGVFAFRNKRTDEIQLVEIPPCSSIAPWKVLIEHKGNADKWRQLPTVPIRITQGSIG